VELGVTKYLPASSHSIFANSMRC